MRCTRIGLIVGLFMASTAVGAITVLDSDKKNNQNPEQIPEDGNRANLIGVIPLGQGIVSAPCKRPVQPFYP